MATGDQNDIANRLATQVPPSWFPSGAVIVAGLHQAFATCAAYLYGLIAVARLQTRLATATGFFLDLWCFDLLGRRVRRRAGESDTLFRARIRTEVLRERVTRAGMVKAITDLVGNPPIIFEPWNTFDAGSWDTGTFAWDVGGGWGDTNLPNQVLMIVKRPGLQGVPNVGGWDSSVSGWDVGPFVWTDQSSIVGAVTDQDIYDVINTTKPTGCVVWVQLQ